MAFYENETLEYKRQYTPRYQKRSRRLRQHRWWDDLYWRRRQRHTGGGYRTRTPWF